MPGDSCQNHNLILLKGTNCSILCFDITGETVLIYQSRMFIVYFNYMALICSDFNKYSTDDHALSLL